MTRRLFKAALLFAAGALVVLVVAALLSWPDPVDWRPAPPALEGDPDAWLATRENAVPGDIVAGTGKRITWHDPATRERTPLAVVYLLGVSASRQEIAPVPERLAAALGANLFETRLAGHGLEADGLAGVAAEDWLRDADEALAVGGALGERVLLLGTSTGATLALARLAAGDAPGVAGLVMLSPNFAPADPSADLLLEPGGPLLGRLLVGETRAFEPLNESQARYWTTRYPMSAVVEMMRLVRYVRDSLPLELDLPILVLMIREDRVIDVDRALDALSLIDSPVLRILAVTSDDPARHVPAGDVLAPAQTAITVTRIRGFVEDHVLGERRRDAL